MKYLLLAFPLCLLTAACGNQDAAPQTAAKPTSSATAKAKTLPVCDQKYADNLKTCTAYACKEENASFSVVRTIKGLENEKCTEVTEADPVSSTQSPDAPQPAGIEQTCTFTEPQRNKMADFLTQYFASKGAISLPLQMKPEGIFFQQNSAAGAMPNPRLEFLKDGTCSAPALKLPTQRSSITCTGTDSIVVVTTGPDGQEIQETVQCTE